MMGVTNLAAAGLIVWAVVANASSVAWTLVLLLCAVLLAALGVHFLRLFLVMHRRAAAREP